MEWYRVDHLRLAIETIEIEKFNGKSVLINGNYFRKDSKYYSFHETYLQAFDCLLSRLNGNIHKAQRQLSVEQAKLEKFKSEYSLPQAIN